MIRELEDYATQMATRRGVRSYLGARRLPRCRLLFERLRAWWRGRRDGALGLGARRDETKPSDSPTVFIILEEFGKQILHPLMEGFIELWHECQKLRRRLDDRLKEIQEKIEIMMRAAEGIQCYPPTVSQRLYIGLMLLVGAGEFAFSSGSFLFAGIDAMWAEITLAFVTTLVILGLAHHIGRTWRGLPLPIKASPADRLRVWIELALEVTVLACILAAVTKLRAVGMQSQDGTRGWFMLAFLAIGTALTLAATVLAAKSEYSGPWMGLADLERQRRRILDALLEVAEWQEAVTSHKNAVEELVRAAVSRIKATYLYAYERARVKSLRGSPGPPPPTGSDGYSPRLGAEPRLEDAPGWAMISRFKNRYVTGVRRPISMVWRVLAFALAIGGLLFVTGCTRTEVDVEQSNPSLVIELDKSLSVTRDLFEQLYQYFHERVAPTLRPGERVLAQTVVGETTLAAPHRIVDTKLPDLPTFSLATMSLFDDPRKIRNQCREKYPGALDAFAAAVRDVDDRMKAASESSSTSKSTFLIDGINEAADELREVKEGPKTLLVMSDGLEDSTDDQGVHFNFASNEFWVHHGIVQLLHRLQRQGRIPRLDGVAVYFVGASAATTGVYRNTREFWSGFFEAAGVSGLHYGHWPSFSQPHPSVNESERCGGR